MDRKGIIYNAATLTSATSAGGLKTSTTILASNPNRAMFFIQNQDSNPLFIAYGVTASSSIYHQILPAGTATVNGTGGSTAMESGTVFTGLITCYSAGTPSYTVIEIGS